MRGHFRDNSTNVSSYITVQARKDQVTICKLARLTLSDLKSSEFARNRPDLFPFDSIFVSLSC